MTIKDKILLIKKDRIPKSESYFLKLLFSLKEIRDWDSDYLVNYKTKNKEIFRYDIKDNYLIMNEEVYKKIKEYYTIEVGKRHADETIACYVKSMIYKNFNRENVCKEESNKEEYYIQYKSMINNTIFNSVTGKCKKIKLLPFLIPE